MTKTMMEQMPHQRYLTELYKRLGGAMRLGLERTEALMEYLEHPERCFPAIHVAGTNGKGTIVAAAARILECCGLKTGRFTSPHLVKFNERIRINGEMISDGQLEKTITEWQPWLDSHDISFFEICTGLAFHEFCRQQVDAAVVEVGLGGRLDSTNVLLPRVSLISQIDYDHTGILGETLAEIAAEKAGILKSGITALVLSQAAESLDTILAIAKEKETPIQIVEEKELAEIREQKATGMQIFLKAYNREFWVSLTGRHQLGNILLAIEAVKWFLGGEQLTAEVLEEALATLNWPGRFQQIRKEPPVFYDVAHNAGGFKALLKLAKEIFPHQKLIFLIALLRDKAASEILKMVKASGAELHICGIADSHRAMAWEDLQALGEHFQVLYYPSLTEALALLENHRSDKALIIAGSHYIAGEIQQFYHNKSEHLAGTRDIF
jgi:dihydrofolate synthase / folylpolyglutamate synthase